MFDAYKQRDSLGTYCVELGVIADPPELEVPPHNYIGLSLDAGHTRSAYGEFCEELLQRANPALPAAVHAAEDQAQAVGASLENQVALARDGACARTCAKLTDGTAMQMGTVRCAPSLLMMEVAALQIVPVLEFRRFLRTQDFAVKKAAGLPFLNMGEKLRARIASKFCEAVLAARSGKGARYDCRHTKAALRRVLRQGQERNSAKTWLVNCKDAKDEGRINDAEYKALLRIPGAGYRGNVQRPLFDDEIIAVRCCVSSGESSSNLSSGGSRTREDYSQMLVRASKCGVCGSA